MDELVEASFVALGGPLDEDGVLLVVEAPSVDAVRDRLASDPWMTSHLVIDRIEPWEIRLDGRQR